eukprot:4510627-Prymnesium_polylepis.1
MCGGNHFCLQIPPTVGCVKTNNRAIALSRALSAASPAIRCARSAATYICSRLSGAVTRGNEPRASARASGRPVPGKREREHRTPPASAAHPGSAAARVGVR